MPTITIQSKLLPDDFEPDVIIAGGGTAACVLAGRLARATPRLQIVVLEAGDDNHNDPMVVRPGNYMACIIAGKRIRAHTAEASPHVGGRAIVIPAGNGLGGGSSVNFMMYARAAASDFDDWGAPGWAAADLLPLLRKLETYHVAELGDTHGSAGPVHVSHGGFTEPTVLADGSAAVRALGYPVVDDIMDLRTVCAFHRSPRYIDPVTGHRQDTGHRYVHPVLADGLTNLHVVCNAAVVRVLLEDGRAVGVEFDRPAVGTDTGTGDSPPRTITTMRAKKLVVLAAGSFGSPCILQRSGIGSPAVLEAAGVRTLVDLPGVGANYQDHNMVTPIFEAAAATDTHDAFVLGDPAEVAAAETAFAAGRGKFSCNFIDFAGKLRPSPDELSAMGPAFRAQWDSYFRDAPDKPVVLLAILNRSFIQGPALPPGAKFLTLAAYIGYPVSRGSVHITNASDPRAAPHFDAAYLSHPADPPTLVWAYKVAREMARRMRCVVGEMPASHPPFDPASAVRCCPKYDRSATWDPAQVPRLTYSPQDDAIIETWVRETALTTWHSLGTCAMKPRADGGVVDPHLRVHGVDRLMVVDLSICPDNVGANTNNTAILIGEKGAELAAEFLGVEL